MSLISKIHIHFFSKPIASQYRSFNLRHIIFECRCGKRKLKKENRNFGDSFSMSANNLITTREMEDILNANKHT